MLRLFEKEIKLLNSLASGMTRQLGIALGSLSSLLSRNEIFILRRGKNVGRKFSVFENIITIHCNTLNKSCSSGYLS